jgi:tetratricopeptide (TPR) repeat protein
LFEQARRSGSEEDQQQYRLAKMEQSQVELEIYRERVQKYPTDLGLRYRLGRALFFAREFDEAIPALQAAQGDPRHRYHARLLMSRAFFEKGAFAQAVDVLKEICDVPDLPEELGKDICYWLARSLEADGQMDEARAAYSKLLRQDYNYADGEARRRLDALKSN